MQVIPAKCGNLLGKTMTQEEQVLHSLLGKEGYLQFLQ